ncbi:MAG: FtsL-like putative cell division protein [Bacteroidales bacterium]|nr:FtsL-like putative cell division protein [Bacteroidales bacterium]
MDKEVFTKNEKNIISFLKGVKNVSTIGIFPKGFFTSHILECALFLFFLAIYINNRFVNQKKIAEIERQKNELQDLKYEALTRSSELIGVSRHSQVKDLILKQGIELEEADKPAYNLND